MVKRRSIWVRRCKVPNCSKTLRGNNKSNLCCSCYNNIWIYFNNHKSKDEIRGLKDLNESELLELIENFINKNNLYKLGQEVNEYNG